MEEYINCAFQVTDEDLRFAQDPKGFVETRKNHSERNLSIRILEHMEPNKDYIIQRTGWSVRHERHVPYPYTEYKIGTTIREAPWPNREKVKTRAEIGGVV